MGLVMKKLWQTKIQTNVFVFYGLIFLSFISLFLTYKQVSRNMACVELVEHNMKSYKPFAPTQKEAKELLSTTKTVITFPDADYLKKQEEAFVRYKQMNKLEKLSLSEKERDKLHRKELKRKVWGRTCPHIDYSYLQNELKLIELKNFTK